MARRRGFRGTRSRRRQGPVSWCTAIFSDAAIPVTGSPPTLQEMVLLEAEDWGADPDNVSTRKMGHVLRSVGNFEIATLVDNGSFVQQRAWMFWAVYVIDEDDTDAVLALSSGATSIWPNHRVIASGCSALSSVRNTVVNAGFLYSPRIEWDVKARIRMEPEETLCLGVQLSSGIASTLLDLDAGGVARTLIKEP